MPSSVWMSAGQGDPIASLSPSSLITLAVDKCSLLYRQIIFPRSLCPFLHLSLFTFEKRLTSSSLHPPIRLTQTEVRVPWAISSPEWANAVLSFSSHIICCSFMISFGGFFNLEKAEELPHCSLHLLDNREQRRRSEGLISSLWWPVLRHKGMDKSRVVQIRY